MRSMPYVTASTESDIKDLKKDLRESESKIKDLRKDFDKIEKDVKGLEKTIDNLNIGSRQYYQDRTVFTSLQRKFERLEKMEQEWKKYKNELDDSIRKEVEKHTRARVGDTSPKAT
jgi:chromosome segregation ATPase